MDIDSPQHRFDTFRSLMNSRHREILLVSSVHDAYILDEDGTLEESIWQQYADRGPSTVPRIRKVSSVERALEVIRTERIGLVLAFAHEEAELSARGRAHGRGDPDAGRLPPQFADMRDWLYFTQKYFYALDMSPIEEPRGSAVMDRLRLLPLLVAESHWVLQRVASVYPSDRWPAGRGRDRPTQHRREPGLMP